MQWQEALPTYPLAAPGRTVVLEGNAGRERQALLQGWLGEAEAGGARTWLLRCDFTESGTWTGVGAWLEALLPEIEREAPDLLARHDYELTMAVPALRRRIASSRTTLTDAAAGAEAVRNYPVDRAYRIGQGLVELLAAWHERGGGGAWVVACDSYDRSGALVRRFFRELMRRRGRTMELTLLFAVDPGEGEGVAAQLDPATPVHGARVELRAEAPEKRDPAEMTALARELERRVGDDLLEAEIHLQQLIGYWSESEHPHRASKWQAIALGLSNHLGFYEDAIRYVDPVLEHLDLVAARDTDYFTRWNLVGAICIACMALGQPERAYEVVEKEALAKIDDPEDRARIFYVLAMLHARFLPGKDLDAAERLLQQGLEELDRAALLEGEHHFLRVFILNGLAFVRHRQGRAEEAIHITQEGSRHLDEHLPETRHQLHRSVLFYNLAQVYASTGASEEAIASFTAAMEMDPHYSEYYNERGNVYLKMGRLEEAERDYLDAIEYSAPYAEVWTNLGQCYRQMGRMADAVRAYSRALDLEPDQRLARVGRGQAYDAAGCAAEALADYDAALALDPGQPAVLANRAVLHYDAGRLDDSLADLDRAVALAPDHAELYRNRAVALADLGRSDDAADDLESFLRLDPGTPDRDQVEEQLASLRAAVAAA